MKKTILFLLFIVLLSCSQDGSEASENPVTITSVSKLSGEGNTEVTIKGSNFGISTSSIEVFFNGKKAVIKSSSQESIDVIVPVGALTGKITVIVNGKETSGPVFEYLLGHDVMSTIKSNIFETVFDYPTAITVDANKNVYVATTASRQIRKIDVNGVVTNFAGTYQAQGFVNGSGLVARFGRIEAMAVDSKGNLYVCDFGNNAIRKVTPEGTVSTFANSEVWKLGSTTSITVDKQDDVYVATGTKILKITTGGEISIVAGSDECGKVDAKGVNASFCGIKSIAVDKSGNLLVLETVNKKVRKITPEGVVTSVTVTTIVDGVAKEFAKLDSAGYIAVDQNSNVYISIGYDINSILKISADGNGRVLVGGNGNGNQDGLISAATINQPAGLTFDQDDNLYFIQGDGTATVRKLAKEKK